MGHPAAEPDELAYCYDFVSGSASGMVKLALRSGFVCLTKQAEVVICAPASDWPGGRDREKEGGATLNQRQCSEFEMCFWAKC